jgi:hypothetical protein
MNHVLFTLFLFNDESICLSEYIYRCACVVISFESIYDARRRESDAVMGLLHSVIPGAVELQESRFRWI